MELFGEGGEGLKSGTKDEGENKDWASVTLERSNQLDMAVPNAGWLQDQLFPEIDSRVTDSELIKAINSSVVYDAPDTESTQASSIAGIPLLRRKEAKQIKRERATENSCAWAYAGRRHDDSSDRETPVCAIKA
jgi:hypothetical protein